MPAAIDFDRLLSSSQGPGEVLALVDPRSIAAGTPPTTAAWRLFSGSLSLRRAGHTSEANDWFNTSMSVTPAEPPAVLRAEQVAEGGLGLFAAKRLSDAAGILQDAARLWAALCDAAAGVEPRGAGTALAGEIAEMLDALGAKPPAARTKGAGAVKLIWEWLENRAVLRTAEVFAAFIQILAAAEQPEDARIVCAERRGWIERHLTTPESTPLPARTMSGTTRRALYRLMLAKGELELAAGEFQASADSFAEAVKLYDGHVEDTADMSRMIQAHVNQANSLLRLGRYDEALGIYELAGMGFRSIGDEASFTRLEHAKLFARMKKEEAGES